MEAYPTESYGAGFRRWFSSGGSAPYGSFGNGAAMRVGPAGWAFPALEETPAEAARSAECTHKHREGVKDGRPGPCSCIQPDFVISASRSPLFSRYQLPLLPPVCYSV
ncbi:MAG: ADP-ribosylglycohydrolase family protein [Treponema sp.]|nr:ADP-ribosylglycohydrolase family protein [Treponema sp.]